MIKRALAVAMLGGLVLAASLWARPGLPELGMAGKRSVTPDVAGYLKQHGPKSVVECSKMLVAPDQIIDCDTILPNNEPDIELKARNAATIVASSNDYDSCCDAFNTTTDGGTTWANGNMSRLDPRRTGSDPVTVYDVKHRVWLHTSLNYLFNNGQGGRVCDGDLVVSPSLDGVTWQRPTIISDGVGCDTKPYEAFNDKEWIAVDNNTASPLYGRAYVTWTSFISVNGEYQRSPINVSYSDDGGSTWSKQKEISGSGGALCSYQVSGPAGECDENQFSVPAIMPNGTVVVAFENEQNESIWLDPNGEPAADEFDNQYLVVRSTDGGATWSAPFFAAALVDGTSDYPTNARERQTLTGYQLRVNSGGNIAASSSGQLAIVFSDNRAGTAAQTNVNVYAVFSADQGGTWGQPVGVDTSAGDQWFPSADFDPTNGNLGVVYNSRNETNQALYNAVLAEESEAGYDKTTLSEKPSNAVDSLFFQADVPRCEKCALFNGDYIGLEYDKIGVAHAVWTDMSLKVVDDPTFGSGYAQLIAYGTH